MTEKLQIAGRVVELEHTMRGRWYVWVDGNCAGEAPSRKLAIATAGAYCGCGAS